jgi:hypothetical protein
MRDLSKPLSSTYGDDKPKKNKKLTDKELYKGDVKANLKAMKELTGNFKGTMTPRKAKKMLKKYNK